MPAGVASNSIAGRSLRVYRHESGWSVRHCGGHSAIRPWYAVTPEGVSVFSASGGAWGKLGEAQAAVEGALAGRTVVVERPAVRQGRYRYQPLQVLVAPADLAGLRSFWADHLDRTEVARG
jgi:hypothetical protein